MPFGSSNAAIGLHSVQGKERVAVVLITTGGTYAVASGRSGLAGSGTGAANETRRSE